MWGDEFRDVDATPFHSSSSMLVVRTNSPTLGFTTYTNSAGLDAEYAAVGVLKGDDGAVYGVTEVDRIYPAAGVGSNTSPRYVIPGSGFRHVFIPSGCLSGFASQFLTHLTYEAGYTCTVVAEPTASVWVDGWGSRKVTDADTTPDFPTRLATSAATKVFVMIGTNDGAAGVSAAAYETALNSMIDAIQLALPAATIWLASVSRRVSTWPSTEPAWIAGYRTKASDVATAQGVTFVDGTTLYAFSDLGTGAPQDGVHPTPAGEATLAAAIQAIVGTTGRTLLVGDSILCGSSSAADFNTHLGVVGRLRANRI